MKEKRGNHVSYSIRSYYGTLIILQIIHINYHTQVPKYILVDGLLYLYIMQRCCSFMAQYLCV